MVASPKQICLCVTLNGFRGLHLYINIYVFTIIKEEVVNLRGCGEDIGGAGRRERGVELM